MSKVYDKKRVEFGIAENNLWMCFRHVHLEDLKKDTSSHPIGYGDTKQDAYEDLKDLEEK